MLGKMQFYTYFIISQSMTDVRVAEWLALPSSDHEVLGLNPPGGGIQVMIVQHFIAQSFSLSPFHHLDMTSVKLKGT